MRCLRLIHGVVCDGTKAYTGNAKVVAPSRPSLASKYWVTRSSSPIIVNTGSSSLDIVSPASYLLEEVPVTNCVTTYIDHSKQISHIV